MKPSTGTKRAGWNHLKHSLSLFLISSRGQIIFFGFAMFLAYWHILCLQEKCFCTLIFFKFTFYPSLLLPFRPCFQEFMPFHQSPNDKLLSKEKQLKEDFFYPFNLSENAKETSINPPAIGPLLGKKSIFFSIYTLPAKTLTPSLPIYSFP